MQEQPRPTAISVRLAKTGVNELYEGVGVEGQARLPLSRTRIERVAQAVTYQIGGEHCGEEEGTGEN